MAGENYSSYKLLNTDKICKMKCKGTSECCDTHWSVWWQVRLHLIPRHLAPPPSTHTQLTSTLKIEQKLSWIFAPAPLSHSQWPIFGSKKDIFCYTHTTFFFGLRRTRLNGITSPPYPEVTLPTFGVPAGDCLATRRPRSDL